jgi:hypothetical protein
MRLTPFIVEPTNHPDTELFECIIKEDSNSITKYLTVYTKTHVTYG